MSIWWRDTYKIFIHVAVFVFLFLARVRFWKSKSITEVIQSRYSKNTVKRICKLEQLDYHLRKAELHLQFLCKYDYSNLISNFLNLRLSNSHLKYSSTYRDCHLNLLREEIRLKKSTWRSLQKEFSSLKVTLQSELNLIDFAHFSTLFFWITNKILKSKCSIQHKNVYKLLQGSKTENDPEKAIFNFSKYVLSDIFFPSFFSKNFT